jgi:hypothetical protein
MVHSYRKVPLMIRSATVLAKRDARAMWVSLS